MKRLLLSAAALSLLCLGARAQEAAAAADAEREAVKKVVETFLYAEEGEERKGTLLEDAHIVFLDADGKRHRAAPLSKMGGKKRRKGVRILRAPQKIVSIDLLNDAASVKVETELDPDAPSPAKHYQYLWLVKTETGWKVGGVLMPGVRASLPQTQ